jgi:hypothetical protein
MTPLISALAATGWLGLVTLYLWRRRVLQVAHERARALIPALPPGKVSPRNSRARQD